MESSTNLNEYKIWCEVLDQREEDTSIVRARSVEDAVNTWCKDFCAVFAASPSLFEDKTLCVKSAEFDVPTKVEVRVYYFAEFVPQLIK